MAGNRLEPCRIIYLEPGKIVYLVETKTWPNSLSVETETWPNYLPGRDWNMARSSSAICDGPSSPMEIP